MFIQTAETENPNVLKFLPGREVNEGEKIVFENAENIAPSSLAARILHVAEVLKVELDTEHVLVTKSEDIDWVQLKPPILGAIMDYFVSGDSVTSNVDEKVSKDIEELKLDKSDPIVAELNELIETRIKPAATQNGGDIKLKGYSDGVVFLEFVGSAFQLQNGVENMLRHYIPEVQRIADYRDAIPKVGLNTEEAIAIQEVLETRVNPSVAGHGGHISLIDVDGSRAYIRMEGGCQGCGMANVTLKEGVAVEIQKVVPSIKEVLDVTDHAGGTNPYFQG
ncbi:MAG: hypothetical protein CMM83_02510 [Rhodospirillales bacterium]|nr:hypothetical protein [Rhodospirillales bacterium]|tara:strand:- start:513 stop:1349 length:837 start_codon:yes stop_codon:yes gene_type:complete